MSEKQWRKTIHISFVSAIFIEVKVRCLPGRVVGCGTGFPDPAWFSSVSTWKIPIISAHF